MMDAAILNGFGIKRLKNLNTSSNLKRSLKFFLIVSAWCLRQGLSNDNTFIRFETGDTVPLRSIVATKHTFYILSHCKGSYLLSKNIRTILLVAIDSGRWHSKELDPPGRGGQTKDSILRGGGETH
jgi:hypothetical protein